MKTSSHGGEIFREASIRNVPYHEIIDFSANINPLGPPESVKASLMEAMAHIGHYPDIHNSDLVRGISSYVSLPDGMILPGNGAIEIIHTVFRSMGFGRLAIVCPTFSEYGRAAAASGVETVSFVLSYEDGFSLDMEKLLRFVDGDPLIDSLVICNPNNPTSRLIPVEAISHLLDEASRRGITLIVDESFIELTAGGMANSIQPRLPGNEGLIIIRSFTKFLSIPGARLGYMLAGERTVRRVGRFMIPWSINAFASSLSQAIPGLGPFARWTSDWLAEEKAFLYGELGSVPFLRPFHPDSNFILARLDRPGMTSSSLRDKLLESNVMVRDCSNFPGLEGEFIRVAVKSRADNIKLLRALKAAMV